MIKNLMSYVASVRNPDLLLAVIAGTVSMLVTEGLRLMFS
jgi:hypothetical protein